MRHRRNQTYILCLAVASLLMVMGLRWGTSGLDKASTAYNATVQTTLNICTHHTSGSLPLQDNPVTENKDEEKEEKQEKEENKSESNEVIISQQGIHSLTSETTKAFFHYKHSQPTYIILEKPVKPPRYSA